MATLRLNIVANYAGQLWTTLMAIAFIPLYIQVLGIEAFGLVGVMLSLQAISQLFDFGLGSAVNREVARRIGNPSGKESIRRLVRTLEWIIWPMTALVGLVIWASSEPLAFYWLTPNTLSREETAQALAIMGSVIALLWPSTFYLNCLSGLERQPLLNFITAVFATIRSVGVLPVIFWISPTIDAFLGWHLIVAIGQTVTVALLTWKCLPNATTKARFLYSDLKAVAGFAAGIFVITSLAIGLTQIDRIILATLRPLEELGYYTIALSVSAGIGRVVQPMFNALYPRFSRLAADNSELALQQLYHLSSQWMAVVVAVTGMYIMVFSYDILFLWTGDENIAAKVALPLSLLVAGTSLNGLMNVPYALQLANGWTRLSASFNFFALLFSMPLCYLLVEHHGMLGAASLWFLLNLASVVICVPLMHRRLLVGQTIRWFTKDNAPPIFAAAATAMVLSHWIPALSRDFAGLVSLCGIGLSILIAALLASSSARSYLLQWYRNKQNTR